MDISYRPAMTHPSVVVAPSSGSGPPLVVLDRSTVAVDLGARSFVVSGPRGSTEPFPLSELLLTRANLPDIKSGTTSWFLAGDGVAGGDLQAARFAGLRFTTRARDQLLSAGYSLPAGLRQRALDEGPASTPEFDPTVAQTVEAPRILPELPRVALAIPIGATALAILVLLVLVFFLIKSYF